MIEIIIIITCKGQKYGKYFFEFFDFYSVPKVMQFFVEKKMNLFCFQVRVSFNECFY